MEEKCPADGGEDRFQAHDERGDDGMDVALPDDLAGVANSAGKDSTI